MADAPAASTTTRAGGASVTTQAVLATRTIASPTATPASTALPPLRVGMRVTKSTATEQEGDALVWLLPALVALLLACFCFCVVLICCCSRTAKTDEWEGEDLPEKPPTHFARAVAVKEGEWDLAQQGTTTSATAVACSRVVLRSEQTHAVTVVAASKPEGDWSCL